MLPPKLLQSTVHVLQKLQAHLAKSDSLVFEAFDAEKLYYVIESLLNDPIDMGFFELESIMQDTSEAGWLVLFRTCHRVLRLAIQAAPRWALYFSKPNR
jgi:hypothetical protein